jgi:hypothetical protein
LEKEERCKRIKAGHVRTTLVLGGRRERVGGKSNVR